MRNVRTGSPQTEELWDVAEIMKHLNCDEMKARKLLEGCHAENGGGYGKVEKALMLDYIERKQREEREREARYRSDIANAESIAVLKEQANVLKAQVDVLRESSASAAREARKSRTAAYVSNAVAVASFLLALASMLPKVC